LAPCREAVLAGKKAIEMYVEKKITTSLILMHSHISIWCKKVGYCPSSSFPFFHTLGARLVCEERKRKRVRESGREIGRERERVSERGRVREKESSVALPSFHAC